MVILLRNYFWVISWLNKGALSDLIAKFSEGGVTPAAIHSSRKRIYYLSKIGAYLRKN